MESYLARFMDLVSEQLARNAQANLLQAAAPSGLGADPDFLDALRRFAGSPPEEGEIADLAREAAKQFLARVLAVNPYIELEEGDSPELARVYGESARRMISGESPKTVLSEYHYPELQEWTRRKYPESMQIALRFQPTVGSVPYAQYSPQVQMDVLQLRAADISRPLIDLGCGAGATLVRYLRGHGTDAYGIDRALPGRTEYLFPMSWFDIPFEDLTVGIVVSHLAFSSHLLYQHQTTGRDLEAYVALYHRILAALKVGGEFTYAPALPFLEESVAADRFEVERWTVAGNFEASRVTRVKL